MSAFRLPTIIGTVCSTCPFGGRHFVRLSATDATADFICRWISVAAPIHQITCKRAYCELRIRSGADKTEHGLRATSSFDHDPADRSFLCRLSAQRSDLHSFQARPMRASAAPIIIVRHSEFIVSRGIHDVHLLATIAGAIILLRTNIHTT